MTKITLGSEDAVALNSLRQQAAQWANNHQWEVGAIEAAIGASCVCWAVQNGVLTMGADLMATALSVGPGAYATTGGIVGASLGSFAGKLLGSIGVAAMGTAFCIPAGILALGGAFVFAGFGYAAADIFDRYVNAIDMDSFFQGASVLAVGLALMVDGSRRIIGDPDIPEAWATLNANVLWLGQTTAPIVARTLEECQNLARDFFSIPETRQEGIGALLSSTAGSLGGAALGASLGAGSITVLGSSALGGVALSLGLVSAPLWPVIAVGAAGAAAGYGGTRLIARSVRRYSERSNG